MTASHVRPPRSPRLSLGFAALALCAAAPASAQSNGVAEVAKIYGSSTGSSSYAGIAVDVSGATAFVGAYRNGEVASTAGATFVFELQADGSWLETQKLFASSAAQGDGFGRALSLSGDRAIVASRSHDAAAGTDQGAAYVFERIGGTWTEVAELLASDAAAFDEYGFSVAIDGDYATVGTYRNDDQATDAGKVYVYERIGGVWIEVKKLYASDASAGSDFGWSLALDGSTLLVGADREGPPGNGAGAVYAFERQAGTWTETQKFKGTDTIPLDYFGWSLDLDGDVAVIGAHQAESATDPFSWDEGAAYVFERSGSTWTQTALLEGSDITAADQFGYGVGISGDRILVGAPDHNIGGQGNLGAAYLFGRDAAGGWVELAKYEATDGQASDILGRACALSGDVAIVGATGDDDLGSYAGAAYLLDVEPLSMAGGSISLVAGGSRDLALDAGRDHAGELYWVLGSVTGTAPGLPVAPGIVLPLNIDFYFNLTLNKPNQVPLLASFAALNGVGHGAATFLIPAGTDPALAGLVVNHAFLAIDPLVPAATFASNAAPVTLVP